MTLHFASASPKVIYNRLYPICKAMLCKNKFCSTGIAGNIVVGYRKIEKDMQKEPHLALIMHVFFACYHPATTNGVSDDPFPPEMVMFVFRLITGRTPYAEFTRQLSRLPSEVT